MQKSDISHYTLTCFVIGQVGGYFLAFLYHDITDKIIYQITGLASFTWFGTERMDVSHYYSLALAYLILIVISTFILWCSSRLDFLHKDDDLGVLIILFGLLLFIGLASKVILLTRLGSFESVVSSLAPKSVDFSASVLAILLQIIINIFRLAVGVVVGFGVIFAGVIAQVLIAGSTIGLTLAALLCLPRALLWAFIRHPARDAISKERIDAPALVKSLGQTSRSRVEARVLLKEAQALQGQMQADAAKLRTEEVKVKSAILDDINRQKAETEMARLAVEMEQIRTRIEVLKKKSEKGL